MSYTAIELMICCAARELEDGRTVAVGTGVPCAAAMLAQRTHAPNLVAMFEAGGVAPQLPTMPVSVGDSTTFHRAVMATSMADVMQFCQRGMVDYTFLSGAQIDPFGNLNSTYIGGTYEKPKVRLPGSGGANDLASFCWRTLIVMKHDAKKFAPKLDFGRHLPPSRRHHDKSGEICEEEWSNAAVEHRDNPLVEQDPRAAQNTLNNDQSQSAEGHGNEPAAAIGQQHDGYQGNR